MAIARQQGARAFFIGPRHVTRSELIRCLRGRADTSLGT